MITQSKRVALPAWLYSTKTNKIKNFFYDIDIFKYHNLSRVGFEPTMLILTTDLQSATINHSATFKNKINSCYRWKDSNFHHKLRKFAFLPIKLQKTKNFNFYDALNNQLWFSKWKTKIIYPAYNKFN